MKAAKSVALALVLFLVVLVVPSRAGNPIHILRSFSGGDNDGSKPYGSLVLSGSTLYGMTQAGGGSGCYGSGCGTIFSMNMDGSNYRILHTFARGEGDGYDPLGSLVLSGSTLYGMTSDGGYGGGIIFSIKIDGTNYRILHTFDDTKREGYSPFGSLILSGSTLYGMTSYGDSGSTIFSIGTDGSNFRVLHWLVGGYGDGAWPQGDLVLSGSTLYGMTMNGGSSGCDGDGCGTIFSIDTEGSNYRILHSFYSDKGDGIIPLGSLTLSDSTFYGMTASGGGGSGCDDVMCGTIFSIDTDGSNYRILHSFSYGGSDGFSPYGSLTLLGSTLYGMTQYGGSGCKDDGCGTIFSIDTTGSNYQILHSFSGNESDGGWPSGSLISSESILYGMTGGGGSAGKGTIFSFSTGIVYTLTVTKSGSGTVISSPTRLNCGPTCSASFAKGTKVTLTPAPDKGSVFTGWTDGCAGTGTCSVTIANDITVGAKFEAGSCTYAISSSGKTLTHRGGTVTVGVTAKDFSFCAPAEVVNTTGWITHTATPFIKNKGSTKLKILALDSSIGRASEPAAFTIGGNAFTVTQTGKPCSFSLAPGSSRLFPQGGDTGAFGIKSLPADCEWNAVPDGKSTWITIDSGGEGTHTGTVGYTVAANGTGKARTGKIVVTVGGKGKSYTVRQRK